MEYIKELTKLKTLENLILKEKNKTKQLHLISDYFNIVSYLDHLNIIKDLDSYFEEISPFLCNYYRHIEKEEKEYAVSFINNINPIFEMTNKLMDIINKQQVSILEDDDKLLPIDIKLGQELMLDFFGSLNEEFYHLYLTLVKEERISLTSHIDCLGMSFNVTYSDKPYIILFNNGSFYDYDFFSSMAHEIGHCYEFMISEDKRLYILYLLAEVSSLFIQKLFDEYALNNNFYLKEVEKSQISWQKSLIKRTLVNDFVNKMISLNHLGSLDYQTGYFDINIVKYGLDYLNDQLEHSLTKFEPSLDNYLYVIGDHIANNFVKLYKSNPKEALKEFKNFILTINEISFADNIQKYSKDFSEDEKLIMKIRDKKVK